MVGAGGNRTSGTIVAKKLTMKELSALQETANQALSSGKTKSELVSQMIGDGIDELTAQRIAESADARVRRVNDEDLPAPERVFNIRVFMGIVFLLVGIGVLSYTFMRPQQDNTFRIIGGISVVLGLFRLGEGLRPR